MMFAGMTNSNTWARGPLALICLFAAGILLLIICSEKVLAASDGISNTGTIYLDETYISGNQELPKVLYILPWKNQAGGAIPLVKPESSLDRVMTLVYPHEYRLELAFRDQARRAKIGSRNHSINFRPESDQAPETGAGKPDGQTQAILKED